MVALTTKPSRCDHYWRCDTEHVRVPVNQSCSGCNYWFCTICKNTYYNNEDGQGHRRPDLVNNAPLLKNKKVFLKQSLFINNIPLLDVFKGSSDPFKEVHSENEENKKKDIVERSLHSEGDEPNQPLLRAAEKLKRKKEKLFRSREEDLKKEYKHSLSSSSSSKDKDIKPHKKFVINMRKKDSDDEDQKEFDPRHPSRKTIRAGEHPKFKCNGKHTHAKNTNIDVHTSALKKSNLNGLKREGYKPINASKVELKSPKQSNSDKYPLLTQSHIKYSKQEDAKRLSSEKKEEGKVPRASKGEGPKLQYNLNINKNKYIDKIDNDPLPISGLSDLEKAAEANEKSRIGNLTLKIKQLSKVQSSLQPKPKKDDSSVVPSLSKVVKNSERKKADRSDNKASKKQSTFNPSSSSSDSDESETPKGNAKDPKIYTNTPTDNLQKSAFKKTYKEDEGNETPSNSQASLRFNLLKSPKNKHAAPNASASKQNPTGFPSSQTEPQQIGFKTTEGSKEPSKSLKSDEETPKGDTPNGEMPKGETPKSDAKNDKSDGSSSSDEEKQSKRSKSSLSHKSQTPKSDKGSSSNEDKESSSSKKSSKKSVKTYSHDSRSEKHSDDEGLKSDKENNKEGSSSEDAVSSHSKRSSKKSVKFDKSPAESIVNNEPSDKEKQKNPDEESSESDDPSETPGK